MLRTAHFALIALAVPGMAAAQADYGTVNLSTRLGMFKIVKINLDTPAEGRLEMSFKGTVLVSDYRGKEIVVKGDIRKEFPDPKVLPRYPEGYRKVVYHGTGTLILDGKYNAVQWMGRELKAKWTGKGFLRLYGEFDDNGETGTFYYNDPKKINYWAVPSMELAIPGSMYGLPGGMGKPQERTVKPGGKPAPKKRN